MNVHILYEPTGEDLVHLRSLLDKNISLTTGEKLPEDRQVQIFVAGRPTQEQIDQLGSIETLIVPWTGIPPETRSVMLNYPDVRVYKLHHNASATAEMALSLLLAVAKRVIPFDQRMRKSDWRLRYQKSDTVLLDGKNALILGYGKIGKLVRSYLEVLGVQVRIIKRTLTEKESKEETIFPPSKLRELLPETEILILALPHTDDTDNLISHKELALLPRDAILINISRGKIVDQEALYSALKEGKIYGAGLDVWYNYPKTKGERSSTQPADYPFHELDNLVMSPHRGGNVKETEQLLMTALARSLNAAARGEPIPNPVDIQLGY